MFKDTVTPLRFTGAGSKLVKVGEQMEVREDATVMRRCVRCKLSDLVCTCATGDDEGPRAA